MKTSAMHRTDFANRPHLPYPNAATKRQIFDRFIELLLMAALGAGAAASILLVLALA